MSSQENKAEEGPWRHGGGVAGKGRSEQMTPEGTQSDEKPATQVREEHSRRKEKRQPGLALCFVQDSTPSSTRNRRAVRWKVA